MEIFEEIKPLRAFLAGKRNEGLSIGLVPTMGALHQGHLSLMEASKADNDLTVASIYINPTQFNNSLDLDNYPRTKEEDLRLLEQIGCDVLFIPSNSEMYSGSQNIQFDFGKLDKILEGKFRPGHFSGVALVVSKLLNIVGPNRAYFGQKDYQQFKIISRLNDELKFFVDLRSIPIVREKSGLAMSSRNQRLSKAERENALLLVESLNFVKAEIKKGVTFKKLKWEVEARFQEKEKMKLEYLELADKNTLELLEQVNNPQDAILLIAAFVGEVRLIDNMMIGGQE
ncbi:MAG TPA: pantoate--beta-alanine ligase [Cyclobacteriaceae bacterium]